MKSNAEAVRSNEAEQNANNKTKNCHLWDLKETKEPPADLANRSTRSLRYDGQAIGTRCSGTKSKRSMLVFSQGSLTCHES